MIEAILVTYFAFYMTVSGHIQHIDPPKKLYLSGSECRRDRAIEYGHLLGAMELVNTGGPDRVLFVVVPCIPINNAADLMFEGE